MTPPIRRTAPIALMLSALLLSAASVDICAIQARVTLPAEGSTVASGGFVDVEIDFAASVNAETAQIFLRTGLETPQARVLEITDRFRFEGGVANGQLTAEDLLPGRSAVIAFVNRAGLRQGVPYRFAKSAFHWEPALRAAACRKVITPVVGENHSDPIFLAGFGNDRHATGVNDDIWARGIVLETPETKIAIVTLDVVGYFYNEVKTIRELVDPALGFDSITVTATHNHEGPDTMGLWGPSEFQTGVDLGYLDFVNASVVECIEEANASLVPAEIKFATGSTVGTSLPPEPDLVADGEVLRELGVLEREDGTFTNFIEGDPGPIINPTTPSLQLRRLGTEEILATLVNYASHPEALGSGNTLITSDFPHYMRENLEGRYGGVAIYVSGDLGVLQGPLDIDVTDPDTGQPAVRRSFRFAEVMGNILADQAAEALDAVSEWDDAPEIEAVTTGPLLAGLENPFFEAAFTFGIFGRRMLYRPDQMPECTENLCGESEMNAIRIGAAQIAVTPNELDPQIGDVYRAMMTGAEHKFIFGLGNDEVGYQMPENKFNPSCFECAAQVLLGGECPFVELNDVLDDWDCGTVFMNNVGPSADPVLQAGMADLLGQLND